MYRNITQVVLDNAARHPHRACLRFFRGGSWQELPWAVVRERVRAVAGGLAGLGVGGGDRVAIVSENRPEWALADLGSLAAGAMVVSVYATLPPDETAFILGHSRCRVVFAENEALAEKVLALRGRLPALEHLVVLDGPAPADPCVTLAVLEESADAAARGQAVAHGLAAERDTPFAVVYTSGTTGRPKGVVLTHGNLLAVIEAILEMAGDLSDLEVNLSFLPLAHALERVAGHFLPLYLGRTIAYARSLETVAEDLRTVRPSFAVAVPRVFEKIHARVLAQAAARGRPARALVEWAAAVAAKVSCRRERGLPPGPALALRHRLADLLVLRRLRAAVGGRLRFFVSGGAPLDPEVARFFHGAGLLVCEGWGATETCAPVTWNSPPAYRLGSVGRPLPGAEVRIAADGELEVRGPMVFSGYLDSPEETAEAFTADGFYRTGDIGRRDDDGYYYITDRKKELIITAGGKNVAPQKLESLLRRRPLVSNCVVHGDRRRYLVALLTVDRIALEAVHPELEQARSDDPELRRLVEAEVDAVNQELARFEQVKRFSVVEPDFTPEGGELTVTLKPRRRVIEERYRELIEEMYR